MSKIFVLSLMMASASVSLADSFEIVDTFDKRKNPDRAMSRGEFEVSDGILTVGHSPELYAKYKNHGPIVIYKGNFTDAETRLKFKLTQAEGSDDPARGAFTFDGESGHVLRVFTRTNQPGRVAVWNEGDEKPTMLSVDLPKIESGKWYELSVVVKGDQATIKLGDKTASVQHAALTRLKTNAKYSSAFATLHLDEFSIRAK